MKYYLILLIVAFFTTCKTNKPLYVNLGGSIPTENSGLKITAKDYLKSFAMCKCIDLAYKKDSVNLNERSISFLKEMAEDLITPKVDSIISSEVNLYVYRKQEGLRAADGANKRLILADCMFFSESARINVIADSLLSKIHSFPDYWNDKK